MRTAAAEWQATINAIADAVCIVDGGGEFRRCNEAADVLLAQLNGGNGARLFQMVFPPPAGPAANVAGDVLATDQPLRYDTQVNDRWFAVRIDPIHERDELV